MLVGVISDSHDNLPALKKAVEFFNEKKAGFVIHAGDFVAPFALRPLDELVCPWIGVFGNNDGEQRGLTQHSKGRIQPSPFELNLDGKRVVVVHDLHEADREKFIKEGATIIVHGHTHQAEVKKTKKALVVNPGELGGWLHGKKTLALVDTDRLQAEIITID